MNSTSYMNDLLCTNAVDKQKTDCESEEMQTRHE